MTQIVNADQVAFVIVYAWKVNIEVAYRIKQWATTPDVMAVLKTLWQDDKRVYMIFTHLNPDDGRGKRIVGIAQILTDFILDPYPWPKKSQGYQNANCCSIAWIAKGLDLARSSVGGLEWDAVVQPHLVGMAALTQMLENERAVEKNEYVTAARRLFPRQQLQKTIDSMFPIKKVSVSNKGIDKVDRRDQSPKRGTK